MVDSLAFFLRLPRSLFSVDGFNTLFSLDTATHLSIVDLHFSNSTRDDDIPNSTRAAGSAVEIPRDARAFDSDHILYVVSLCIREYHNGT